jgi:hypothetical protein
MAVTKHILLYRHLTHEFSPVCSSVILQSVQKPRILDLQAPTIKIQKLLKWLLSNETEVATDCFCTRTT